MSDFTIVNADEVDDAYADSDVPGEFRALSEALGTEQVAVTTTPTPRRSRTSGRPRQGRARRRESGHLGDFPASRAAATAPARLWTPRRA